eukprot:3949111-Amphidinium_carterae.1
MKKCNSGVGISAALYNCQSAPAVHWPGRATQQRRPNVGNVHAGNHALKLLSVEKLPGVLAPLVCTAVALPQLVKKRRRRIGSGTK